MFLKYRVDESREIDWWQATLSDLTPLDLFCEVILVILKMQFTKRVVGYFSENL